MKSGERGVLGLLYKMVERQAVMVAVNDVERKVDDIILTKLEESKEEESDKPARRLNTIVWVEKNWASDVSLESKTDTSCVM